MKTSFTYLQFLQWFSAPAKLKNLSQLIRYRLPYHLLKEVKSQYHRNLQIIKR